MRPNFSVSRFWVLGLILMFSLPGSPGAQGPPPARVVVDRIFEKELAPTTPMIGVLDFDKKSGLSSEINGLIQALNIEEGVRVAKGDILVRLNTDFLKKDIEILTQQVAQIEVKVKNTRRNVQRYEKLFNKSAASEKAYSDLADSLSELLLQQAIIRKRIEKEELQIAKSRIRAPFDGLILEKKKAEGEWLATGKPVCTLASIEDVVVRVAVPEALIRYVKVGQKITLFIDALEKTLQGRVDNIVPVADVASKTFQLKIAIPYTDNFIQNMSVTAHIPVKHKMTLKMIRRDALVRNQGKEFIYTVKEDKASILPVTIATYEGELVGLTDAFLAVGMPVVIDGNERLRPGQAVSIVDPKSDKSQSQ